MEFIGEISTESSTCCSWILVAKNYFTKWVEAIPTRKDTRKVVNNFLLNNIITKFGCPERIDVTNNSMCFRSEEFIIILLINMVLEGQYHPPIIHKGMCRPSLPIRVF